MRGNHASLPPWFTGQSRQFDLGLQLSQHPLKRDAVAQVKLGYMLTGVGVAGEAPAGREGGDGHRG